MSLRQRVGDLSSIAISIVRTRLELFALEAGEQKASLLKLLALLFGALLFSTLALLVFSLLIALFFWPTEYRYWAIGVLIVIYAGLGAIMFLSIVNRLNKGPIPFSATIEELGRDIEMLERLRSNDGER
ncbi:phage holin family protein [uncultured Paenalcaligenes sp.]|uniref:phage holin family protein n=1 Tax=uncultured Paenalcaligenes sp. TaxID=1588925 RepID=UPI00262CB5C6|nr:phage holin family protein [uncultured Paenalcaligenes sp.]